MARPVKLGMSVLQAEALRLMTHEEPDCDPEVSDLWWWREGADLCVWAEAWPTPLALPQLNELAWRALDQGKGQWFIVNAGNQVAAAFQLSVDRRCAVLGW